jgi:YidC/Oxa1 family membrane protein insertase
MTHQSPSRIFLAALLSVAFISLYTHWVGKRQPPRPVERAASAAPDAQVHLPQPPQLLAPAEEPTLYLKGPLLWVAIGQARGAIREAVLPTFQDDQQQDALRLSGESPLVQLRVGQGEAQWTLEGATDQSVIFRVQDGLGQLYRIGYQLKDQGVIEYFIEPKAVAGAFPLEIWSAHQISEEASRYTRLQMSLWGESQPGSRPKHKLFYAPLRHLKNVPRGTFQLSLADNYFCQSIRFGEKAAAVALLPTAKDRVATHASLEIQPEDLVGGRFTGQLYFGPRDFFYLNRAGFEKAFKIGMLGQIGLMMLALLSAIARWVQGYGVAIILFSGIISLLLAPFTLISHRSMKKMQQLQPQMNALMKKHQDNPQRLNQEMLALYKQHRVSPMSGCLPMVLQLPIFIALFQAISHFIELRGERFLWIKDLSQPDRIATLPFALPFLGDAVNLLPVLMAMVMYVQTRMSQAGTQAVNNPTAKLFSGPLFPILFTALFYSFPSGLVLYYLVNSLISIWIYRWVRR